MYLLSRLVSQAPEFLVTLLVFSLSTGVVGGIVFYLDSSGPDVISEMSEEIFVDMEIVCHSSFYLQSEATVEDFQNLAVGQEAVESASSLSVIRSYDQNISDPNYRQSVILGASIGFLSSFKDAIEIAGGHDTLNDSNCYISQRMFLEQGWEIGDNYTLSIPLYDDLGNLTRVEHSLIITGVFDSPLFQYRATPSARSYSILGVIATRDALWNAFSELPHEGLNSIQDRIWVRFDKTSLSRNDPKSLVSELSNIEKRIEQRILPIASVSSYAIIDVISEYSSWATSMRVIALSFAIPSVIMGLMLVYYNEQILADQRRKNVGTLKTRGASGRQAFSWVLSLILTTGIIGSVGALATGAVSALLSGSIREFMVFDISQLSSYQLAPLPISIISLFLYSFVVGLAVGVPSAIGALLMTPVEAHGQLDRNVLLEVEKMTSPLVLIAGVSLSGLLLIPILGILQSAALNALSSMLFALTLIILLTIFVAGLSMLLSRPAAALKSRVMSQIQHQSVAIGARILGRTGRAFKKSETYSLMFIGLVFTASIFSALAATTGSSHMKELFQFQTGADIVAVVNPNQANVTMNLVDNITRIDGVSNAAAMLSITTSAQFWLDWYGNVWQTNRTVTVYGVQLDNWMFSAFILPYSTFYETPENAYAMIKGDSSKVLGSFKPIIDYETGPFGERIPVYDDFVTIKLPSIDENHYVNCSIVDVIASGPGGYRPSTYGYTNFDEETYFPGERGGHAFFVMDIEEMHSITGSQKVSKFYISLGKGANYSRIIEEISEIAPSSFTDIETPYHDIDLILDSRAGQSIYGAYTLNVVFSILYLTAGVTLVITVKIRTLRKHFSLLRALGTEPSSIEKAVLLDSLFGTCLGLISGIVVGVLVTGIMLQMPVMYLGLSSGVSWGLLPLTLTIPYDFLLIIIGTALVFSILATRAVIRRALAIEIADDLKLAE
ncbi:MAG: FtsX-like permease family protein [Promethearchaeota archaeon]